ncbi:hypothetical protein [Enterococcus avium]|uniref:hypothetical protein n=1 Tax=Enterococcus avium TaxID=33945 RepID=UPI0032E37EC3
MTGKEKEKVILFQGNGYRVLAKDNYNVVLEVCNEDRKYSFVGYYSNIPMALRALVRRDLLINHHVKHDTDGYVKEVVRYKQQIMEDINTHFTSAEDDELFN